MVIHTRYHIEGGFLERDTSQVLHITGLSSREQNSLKILWRYMSTIKYTCKNNYVYLTTTESRRNETDRDRSPNKSKQGGWVVAIRARIQEHFYKRSLLFSN